MLFDEDVMLLSFFQRFSDADEEEYLKEEMIKYAKQLSGASGSKVEESTTTGESIDDVSNLSTTNHLLQISSPMDSGVGMKKRMAQLAAAKKKNAAQKKEINLGINDCDLGASPQMSKGVLFGKKF